MDADPCVIPDPSNITAQDVERADITEHRKDHHAGSYFWRQLIAKSNLERVSANVLSAKMPNWGASLLFC